MVRYRYLVLAVLGHLVFGPIRPKCHVGVSSSYSRLIVVSSADSYQAHRETGMGLDSVSSGRV
jgi:hypothetical protein